MIRVRTLTASATAAVSVVAVAGWALPLNRIEAPISILLSMSISFVSTGLFLMLHRPQSQVSRLTWFIGVAATTALAAVGWSEYAIAAWVTQWLWWLPVSLLWLLLVNFPQNQQSRTLAQRFVLTGSALSTLLLAAAAIGAPRTLVTETGASIPDVSRMLFLVAFLTGLVPLCALVWACVVLTQRARKAKGVTRWQLMCLLPSAVLLVIGVFVDGVGLSWGFAPGIIAFPLGLGVAVLEYHFDDLDIFVHRGVISVVTSLMIVLLYASVLTLIDRVLLTDADAEVRSLSSVAALACCAVALDPFRCVLQRQLARFLFGSRDDPYLVLSDLGRHLEQAKDPLVMLSNLCAGTALLLRLPYVGIRLDRPSGSELVADYGRPLVEAVGFPMALDDRCLGELIVSPRGRRSTFTAQETRLLVAVGRQATVAAEAYEIELARQRALQDLVLAQRRERSRIRRDLHDGLGPVLAGVRLALQSLAQSCSDDRDRISLRSAIADLGVARTAIRRLIDDLGPEALEEGLAASVRHVARRVLVGLDSELRISREVDDLPRPLAVALLNIASEAMANASRHGGAKRCWVSLECGSDIRLTVRDDGQGGDPNDWIPGVGLISMRDRATACGGKLSVSSDSAGTTVMAVFPKTA